MITSLMGALAMTLMTTKALRLASRLTRASPADQSLSVDCFLAGRPKTVNREFLFITAVPNTERIWSAKKQFWRLAKKRSRSGRGVNAGKR